MPERNGPIYSKLSLRVVLVALAAGLLAGLFSLQIEDVYRARVLLNLTYLRFDQRGMPPGTILLQDDVARRINYVQAEIMQPLTPPDYKLIFTGNEIVEALRDAMRELYTAAGYNADSLSLEKVAQSLDVVSKIEIQTTQQVKYHGILELVLTARDPKVAAAAANLWADTGLEAADRMRNAARTGTLAYLEQRFEEAIANRDTLAHEVEDYAREWNPPGMQVRLADMENALTQLRLKRMQLALDTSRIEGEIAQLETDLSGTSEKIELRQGPPDPAYRLSDDAIRRLDASKVLLTEAINPVVAENRRQWAALRGEMAGLRAMSDALDREESHLISEAEALRADLARIDRELSTLALKLDAHTRQADVLMMTMHAVQLAGANIVPECRIVSRAIPPEEKIAPRRGLMVVAAMLLAAAAVLMHYFGSTTLRYYAHVSGDRAVESR